MDKKQFSMFVMALKTYYPRENLLHNNQAIELWYRQLQDIPYKVLEASLEKWVAINKWSPSIADIRELAASIMDGDIPDWGEAWEKVVMAIRSYGTYRIDEAMESFDSLTRKAVERLGFYNICMSENLPAERANFRMIYEQLADRQKKEARIPGQTRMMIEQIRQGSLEGLESNESKRIPEKS